MMSDRLRLRIRKRLQTFTLLGRRLHIISAGKQNKINVGSLATRMSGSSNDPVEYE